MGRDGTGTAWRRRQWRKPGEFGPRRKKLPRELKVEPQFGLDDVFITPFRWRRRYSEDGEVTYVAVERRTEPTGIRVFDEYVRYLSRGGSDLKGFADGLGLRREDIDALVFVLTGRRGVDFRQAYQVRTADELLRYTALPLAEVARLSGLGSANNLYLTYKREFNVAPGERRLALRKQGDVGRYKL